MTEPADFRSPAEYVTVSAANCLQGRHATAQKQVNINSQPSRNVLHEGFSVTEILLGSIHKMGHQSAECRTGRRLRDIPFITPKQLHCFSGDIDPSPRVIPFDILPEIGELQTRADLVRKGNTSPVVTTADEKYQLTHGIGRVVTVA